MTPIKRNGKLSSSRFYSVQSGKVGFNLVISYLKVNPIQSLRRFVVMGTGRPPIYWVTFSHAVVVAAWSTPTRRNGIFPICLCCCVQKRDLSPRLLAGLFFYFS